MPLTSSEVLVPLKNLLRSCFSPDVQELRMFLAELPGGIGVVEGLTTPGSFATNVHEAALDLMALGKVDDGLFAALATRRPAKEAEITLVRGLVRQVEQAQPEEEVGAPPTPGALAELIASLDEVAASLTEFVGRVQQDGVSLSLFEARARVEVVRHRLQDTDLRLIGGARLAGLLHQLEAASRSRASILAGLDDDQQFQRLGTVVMAAAYARELAQDLREAAGLAPATEGTTEAVAPVGPSGLAPELDLSSLGLPQMTDEELAEEALFAWQQNAEIDDLEEAPVLLESTGGALAEWPDDVDSIDYAHLVGTPDGEVFTLTHAVLSRLLTDNHFDLGSADLVVFGLRGCRLAGDVNHHLFANAIECIEARPDHVHTRCTIGLWRRSAEQVAAFTGSTVPNANWLSGYVAGGINTNMLPTGVYRFVSGRHRAVPGALRMAQARFHVARPVVGKPQVILTNTDRFTGPRLVPDNIHPAYNPSAGVEFNSAGCQTIQGTYWKKKDTHYGAWSVFRQLAGIATHGRAYTYVLLTGREARLAAELDPADESLWRLRFGSRGPAVRQLQTAIGAGADGHFGPGTMGALVERQRADGNGRADGIVSRERLAAMHVS